jgi:hypothetical protein
MSKKRITIASILLLIILIIIGIGIGIASANKIAVAELHLNATSDLKPASELRGLTARGGTALLDSHLKELSAAKKELLHVDVLKLS